MIAKLEPFTAWGESLQNIFVMLVLRFLSAKNWIHKYVLCTIMLKDVEVDNENF